MLLALLELGWLGWFLVEPLPNFPKESGTTCRRGFLLLKAIPEVVPGTTFRESLIGQAARELSHVENLPQRMPIVGAAALVVLAALGLGELILGGLALRDGMRPAERLAVDFGIGTTALGVLTLLAGRLGLLDPWIFRIGLGVIAAAGLGTSKLWRMDRPRLDLHWLLPGLIDRPFPDHHAPGSDAADRSISTCSNIISRVPRSISRQGGSRSCRTMSTPACPLVWRCST